MDDLEPATGRENQGQNHQAQPQYPPVDMGQSDEHYNTRESFIEPEVGGKYAPLMRLQYERQIENSLIMPLPPKVIGGVCDQIERLKACHCQKTTCLKLYCECFNGGLYCNANCICQNCQNDGSPQFEYYRNRSIIAHLERNPRAFRIRAPVAPHSEAMTAGAANYASAAPTPKRRMPCKCEKSRCLKKYCECFGANSYCMKSCKCVQCDNVKGNKEREFAMIAAKSRRASRNQRMTDDKTRVNSVAATAEAQTYLYHAPPSTTTTPFRLRWGDASPTLAFGKASGSPETSDTVGNGNVECSPSRTSSNKAQVHSTQSGLQRALEHKWSVETQDVMGTFQAMSQELLERKRDEGLLEGDIALSREYSYYDIVGSAQVASLELELADVIDSVKEAAVQARQLISQSTKDANGEERPKKTQKMDSFEREEKIVEAFSDAALMREMARIIRQRAQEMEEARTSAHVM